MKETVVVDASAAIPHDKHDIQMHSIAPKLKIDVNLNRKFNSIFVHTQTEIEFTGSCSDGVGYGGDMIASHLRLLSVCSTVNRVCRHKHTQTRRPSHKRDTSLCDGIGFRSLRIASVAVSNATPASRRRRYQ